MRTRTLLCVFLALAAPCAFARLVVTAESAIVIAARSGKVLYEKDADAKRYPASTTKIMTALLLAERVDPDTIITAPDDVESVGGSSLHLRPGEKVSAGDLLLAILLRSANDAAYTVALYMGGSVENFAKMMNDRAKEIGCTNTHFVNPHGLHDPDHYTTARDLAKIARVAMQNKRFAKAAGSISKTISRSDDEEDVVIKTHNKFLETRPDATGVKTGWTVPAGRCFVGSAERDGLSVITVVLKSDDWLDDSDVLADWAFETWHRVTLV
ncbi:MAG TPA: D-alanyl-D-alanine carboxypeptidase family protein, partial [Fimbriimonadaceae bacterium]|nr:D-alanyl-D-alanine carboxypeptidase family protein [Fimbriimonadaceae bacterium]